MRPDQSWCSLCYSRVVEAFDPLTAPLDEVLGQVESETQVDVAVTPPAEQPEESFRELDIASARLTLTHGSAAEPPTGEGVEVPPGVSDVDVMLSMLAAEHKAMDPAAGLTDRLGDRSTRVAIMVGGTLVVGAFLFALLTLFGAIF
jgi:hypothetical protein